MSACVGHHDPAHVQGHPLLGLGLLQEALLPLVHSQPHSQSHEASKEDTQQKPTTGDSSSHEDIKKPDGYI